MASLIRSISRAPGQFELLMSHYNGNEVQFEFKTPAADSLSMPGVHRVTCVVTYSEHPDGCFSIWDVRGPVRKVESAYGNLPVVPERFRAKFSSHTRQGTIELL